MSKQMPVIAPPPFDNPDADIILRSSDQPSPTDFRVFKFLLTLASPFFVTAFALPQPSTNGSEDVPVMEMQENAKTLRMILGFCYPISVHQPPRLTTLEDIRAMLQAAEKFEMKGIQEHVRKTLVDVFLEDNPVSVFAIACHYKWKEVIDDAAYRFIALPKDSGPTDELDFELISAATYRRLLKYRKECGAVARNEVLNLADSVPWDDRKCSKKSSCDGVNKWWVDWMINNAKAFEESPRRTSIDLEVSSPICKECKQYLRPKAREYAQSMFVKIKKKISAVKIDIL